MAVVVVTDSSCGLEPEVAADLGIRVVPLHVLVDGLDLRDGVDEMPANLFVGAGITTSGASPGELTDAYAQALEDSDGDGVVAVHISRQLSGTWDAGRQAAQELGEKVRIVDSRSTAMALGYAVLAAARVARAGGSLRAVYERAVEVADRGRVLIMVDRLDHLRRGGRIGTAAALFGTALAMKPVLHLVDGKLVLREKTRTVTKALGRLVDGAVELAAAGTRELPGTESRDVAVAVHHVHAAERAEQVAAALRERLPDVGECVVAELGPVVASHLGPGAVGVLVVPGGSELPASFDARSE
ncbi:DegV family protein [Rhodococcus triatomae]